MHYGQICNSGISCTTTCGDRQMADFFGFKLDPSGGALRIVFNDTTNEFDGAGLFEARQIAGSTALGGTARGSGGGATGMADVSGDAQWPHYGPAGAGANLPQLDLTAVKLTKPSADVLRVQMSAASLASLLPPAGKTSSVWLTRFQALSPRPGGSEDVYRIFYVGAEATAGVTPQYFAGTATCQETTPGNCKIFQYPVQQTVTGSRLGNSFVIDVNLSSGFGSPVHGSTLYNVTAFTFGRSNSVDDLYADVDATGSFDFAK
jgi:hypothetical protein